MQNGYQGLNLVAKVAWINQFLCEVAIREYYERGSETEMILHKFFSEADARMKMPGLQPFSSQSNHRILLSGPPHSGQSSLLLQFAYNIAKETGGIVVFLCTRQGMENDPPLLSQDIDPLSCVFERVHMKYLENDEGLRKYFAAFHMNKDIPRAVIIHNLSEFFDERKCQERYGQHRGRDVAFVRTLALCSDAIDFANESLTAVEPCKLLLSDVHVGDAPKALYIYQRWLTHILAITVHDGFTFICKAIDGPDGSKSAEFAKYSVALQHLALEELMKC